MRREISDETRANEQEQCPDHHRYEKLNHSKFDKISSSQADLPDKTFSHGSIIVKANVDSNHIRNLHTNAPNADVGGRFGNVRDVMTESVDGAEQVFPSLEEPGFRSLDLPIG